MQMRASERHALDAAVLASILLHAVLLSALPGWREWQRPPAPILARLLPEPSPAEHAALLQQSSLSLAKPLSSKRSASQRVETSAREALAPAANAPEPAQDSSQSAAEPSASVGVANVAAPRTEPVSPPPAAPAADAGTLARYRLAIISLAKGFNRYPRVAIENNWQGRVDVHMSVGADGAITSLGLRGGSGYEILDRQALDMIGQAAPQVALPEALRGREFALDIPVIFSLKEAQR